MYYWIWQFKTYLWGIERIDFETCRNFAEDWLEEINQSKEIVKEEKTETALQIQAQQKAIYQFFDDNFDTFVPKCKELFEENQDNDV